QLLEVGRERRRRVDVRMREQQLWVGRRLSLRSADSRAHGFKRLGTDRLREGVVQDPGAPQVPLVPPDAFPLLLLLDTVEVDVRAWIVGSRVRRRSIRDRLDD